MPQGKFKSSKTKHPGIKKKQKQNNDPFHRRHNAPVMPKKSKHNESQKLKTMISKDLNKNVEKEIRALAVDGVINLSRAQETVKSSNVQARITAKETIEAATNINQSQFP